MVIVAALLAMACSCEQDKFGQGGRNACQFVKEQVAEMSEDIESIEVVSEDSLLGDAGMTIAKVQLASMGADYLAGKVTKDEFDAVIDSVAHDATDVSFSWHFGMVVNDSLKQIKRYDALWRRAYLVKVKMKSGTSVEVHVLMDNDGITPRMMDSGMDKVLRDFTDNILKAQDLMYDYY